MRLYLSPLPACASVSDHNETERGIMLMLDTCIRPWAEMPMRLQAVWRRAGWSLVSRTARANRDNHLKLRASE